MMDRAIAINTTDKFRNQYVEVTILVPVGHHIMINKAFGYSDRVRLDGYWDRREWDFYDDNSYDYRYGIEYVMREEGLFTLQGYSSDDDDSWRRNEQRNDFEGDEGYRYNENNFDSIKEVQELQIQKMQQAMETVKAAKEQERVRIKDSLRKVKEAIDQKIEKLERTTAFIKEKAPEKEKKINPFIMHI